MARRAKVETLPIYFELPSANDPLWDAGHEAVSLIVDFLEKYREDTLRAESIERES